MKQIQEKQLLVQRIGSLEKNKDSKNCDSIEFVNKFNNCTV